MRIPLHHPRLALAYGLGGGGVVGRSPILNQEIVVKSALRD